MVKELERIHKILADGLGQKITLRVLKGNPVIVDRLLLPKFCRDLIVCIGSQDFDFTTNTPFALSLKKLHSKNERILEPRILASHLEANINQKSNLLVVNYNGELVNQEEEFFEDQSGASLFSEKTESLIFYVHGKSIYTLLNGILIDTIKNTSAYKLPGLYRGDEYHIEQYQSLLDNYQAKVLKEQKGIYCWHDKKQYKLVREPEKRFRQNLARYMEQNTVGCIVSEEAMVDGGDNRTDIKVTTTFSQNLYYFELKCLGKLVSSEYKEDYVNAGLEQVNQYVISDTNCLVGLLIVIDARRDKQKLTWYSEILEGLDHRIDDPKVLGIDPKTASVIGREKASQIRKKSTKGRKVGKKK